MRIVRLTSINLTDVNNPRVKNIEPTEIDIKYFNEIIDKINRQIIHANLF